MKSLLQWMFYGGWTHFNALMLLNQFTLQTLMRLQPTDVLCEMAIMQRQSYDISGTLIATAKGDHCFVPVIVCFVSSQYLNRQGGWLIADGSVTDLSSDWCS